MACRQTYDWKSAGQQTLADRAEIFKGLKPESRDTMGVLKLPVHLILMVLVLSGPLAVAVPTFQVYVVGGTAGDIGGDNDTWFSSGNTFDLVVVGAYQNEKKPLDLRYVTLLLSVPEGETGTISITGGDQGATLLASKEAIPLTAFFNPNADADIALLDDVSGDTGYGDKSFLPVSINSHYPFQEDVSDFLIYDIGSFSRIGDVNNYNADGTGSINVDGIGQEKKFSISVDGFSRVHLDAYGYVVSKEGVQLEGAWEMNPGSHDATYTRIPAPGAVLLGAVGVGLVGWLRRRRTL